MVRWQVGSEVRSDCDRDYMQCVTIRIHSAGFDCLSLDLGLICVQGES